MMDLKDRRAARLAQAKHRGTANSHATELENALIVLAWEATELSEGQCAAIFDTDRITLRKMRETLIARGLEVAAALYPERDHV